MRFTKPGLPSSFFFAVTFLASQPVPAVAGGDGVAGIRFSPASGVEANLVVRDHEVDVALTGARGSSTETIAVETEKTLKIKVEDYNFDGHKDFSVSHIDDGMGTYEIYQVYLYSDKEKKFVLLAPPCGDEFINLVLDKRAHTLINSYMVDNRYKTCKKKF